MSRLMGAIGTLWLMGLLIGCGDSTPETTTGPATAVPTAVEQTTSSPTATPKPPSATPTPTAPDGDGIAAKVAQAWTQHEDAISALVRTAGTLVSEKLPGVQDLSAQLTVQLREDLQWSVTLPRRLGPDLWRVTVTATTEFEVDPPILKPIPFTLKVPVDLDIDTATKEVKTWTVNAELATVARKDDE